MFLQWDLSFLPMHGLLVALIYGILHSLKLSDSTTQRSKLKPVLAYLPDSAGSSKLSAPLREIEKCDHPWLCANSGGLALVSSILITLQLSGH